MSRPSGGPGRPSYPPEGQANVVAFVATATGTGCTGTVANLACALAIGGRRVLVVDWGAASPRVGEFLRPLLVDQIDVPARLTPARGAGPEPPMSRYSIPGADGYVDVLDMVNADGSPRFPAILDDATSGAALRKLLPTTAYDHVLVDAPAVESGEAVDLIARVCDIAVVCFLPRGSEIRAAAGLAARLRDRAPIRIDIVPVATAFNERHPSRTRRIRAIIRHAFTPWIGSRRESSGAVELPSWLFDPFDPVIALLAEEPTDTGQLDLHTGYAALTAAVTGGEVTAVPDISAQFRGRYRAALGMSVPGDGSLFLVAWTPRDRAWADWVRSRLEGAGARTQPLTDATSAEDRALATGLVVVSSVGFDLSDRLPLVTATLEIEPGLEVFRIVVDGEGTQPVAAASASTTAGPDAAMTALLGFFELIEPPGTTSEVTARPPGDRPAIFDVPPRHPHFVGRDDEVERLRDALVEHPDHGTDVTVGGSPGVGKSELALEYAYRFAGDYDLVFWLSAADKPSTMLGLTRLAGRLALPGSQGFGSTGVLRHLAAIPPGRRFLLVYDNVADETEVEALRPGSHHGHVIVTASESRSTDVRVGGMTESDAVAMLAARVPGLSLDDAARVAATADHLPMAMELVASWLTATAADERDRTSSVEDAASWAVRQFLHRFEHAWDARPEPTWQITVSRVVRVVVDTLRDDASGRLAVAYAEFCSYLSQDGVSLDLVRSSAVSQQLVALHGEPAREVLLDSWEIDRVLWLGARYGLFRIDWGRQNALRVHRTVQKALRELPSEEDAAAHRAAVLRALASYAPNEVEENQPHAVERLTELQKHVFPSGSTASGDALVRRWLVNQTRYLYAQGGTGVHREAVEPVEKLLSDWTTRHGSQDPLRLRLAVQLANLHRALGDHNRALELDESTLAQHRRTRTTNHPQSLINARGLSADLRGLGHFGDALAEDRAVWEGMRAAFGEDHRQTQMAAGNLTSSLMLSGDVAGALVLARSNHTRRRHLFGDQDPSTWTAYAQVAIYRRELGEYAAAFEMLTEAWQHLATSTVNEVELAVRWHQAIAQRCDRKAIRAKEKTDKVLLDYRELHGADHPNTLACTVSYVAAVRAVGGDEVLAVDLAETALEQFRANPRFPVNHPFVALYQLSVGLARCAAGRGGLKETTEALALLYERLGDVHPWTLAAAVDHARVLAASGQLGPATTLLETTRALCTEFLGAKHPHTAIAAHNLALAHDTTADPADQKWREIDVDVPEI